MPLMFWMIMGLGAIVAALIASTVIILSFRMRRETLLQISALATHLKGKARGSWFPMNSATAFKIASPEADVLYWQAGKLAPAMCRVTLKRGMPFSFSVRNRNLPDRIMKNLGLAAGAISGNAGFDSAYTARAASKAARDMIARPALHTLVTGLIGKRKAKLVMGRRGISVTFRGMKLDSIDATRIDEVIRSLKAIAIEASTLP